MEEKEGTEIQEKFESEKVEKINLPKASKPRILAKQIGAVIAGLGIVASGYKIGKSLEEMGRNFEPVEKPEQESVLEKDFNLEEPKEYIVQPSQEKTPKFSIKYFTQTPETFFYENYKLSVSEQALEQLRKLREKDGELIEYPVYELVRTNDFTANVEKFAQVVNAPEGTVGYIGAEDALELRSYEQPLTIPDFEINPTDEKNVLGLLEHITEKYFDLKDLNFAIEEISQKEGYVEIEFTRFEKDGEILLKHSPSNHLFFQQNSLGDWGIVEGKVPLVELRKKTTVPLISPEEVLNNLNTPKLFKTIVLGLPSDIFNEGEYMPTGEEKVEMEIQDFKIALFVTRLDNGISAPTLLFVGKGSANMNGQQYDIQPTGRINGLSLEFIQ